MERSKMINLAMNCDRSLPGRGLPNSRPAKILAELAKAVPDDLLADVYGEGELIESFEKDMAVLLGKEAAVFMPSGSMAQQIALRVWSDHSHNRNVAFHPYCHLQTSEEQAYRYLHNLNAVMVGSLNQLMTLDDLKKVREPLGSLLLELPQRDLGGMLPSWEDLQAILAWTRNQGITLHMDGARLWQCKPYYQREYSEIAAGFDSVYVSMYKDLQAIAGSVLAGPKNFIAEARVWMRRHGGNLISMYPFVLSARYGIEHFLPKIEQYRQKALEVAAVLSSLPNFRVLPNPPQTNMMHVFIEADTEKLDNAIIEAAEKHRIMLFRGFFATTVPGILKTELTIGDGALALEKDELAAVMQQFLQTAGII
jgi:threonine aldolase